MRLPDYTEDALVEQPAIELFESLGWETANCMEEWASGSSSLGRDQRSDVVLVDRLRPALERLNPDLPKEAISQAVEALTETRIAASPEHINRDLYELIRNGVKVTFSDPESGGQVEDRVKVIDWKDPDANDWFLVSQFWIKGDMYERRPDLVGFVNGLPLLFMELKAAHANLENAYNDNLRDYKGDLDNPDSPGTIPQIFHYNAFIILSNGEQSRVGTISARWEHFSEWKKINSEGEEGIVSLDTVIRGTCSRENFLDLVENFVLFHEGAGGVTKFFARNHQFLGVNNAIDSLDQLEDREGKLGVFWHTQGSGKSISMIYFAEKVFRTRPGNWTFVIVTDRQDLDTQIYKDYFAACGVVGATGCQATSASHLRDLLRGDQRYVFTLINKFLLKEGEQEHPILSERDDIIVITDEAHRTQYGTLALNMRQALPNAAFIAFTGTPLIKGEDERTKEVFGDYVSVYDFQQSVEDNATVPLYYENRIPELQLTNENFNEELLELIDEAQLDEEQEKKLEREFARQYHLITRDERLETVARDVVRHFVNRGFRGKAMVAAIDKATAVRMHDKVRIHWAEYLAELKAKLPGTEGEEAEQLADTIRWMEETDMAVVVSQAQNEIDDMAEKGLDIRPHRERMVKEDLETKFKKSDNPLRLVFVCAMWMTGFDVPSCSTIYLDKPMKSHTLMQTIARANRVYPGKASGLIVDYVGIFRHLQKALSVYGSGGESGTTPIKDKAALVEGLRKATEEAEAYCRSHRIDLDKIRETSGFERVNALSEGANAALAREEIQKKYMTYASQVRRLFDAALPDETVWSIAPRCQAIVALAKRIQRELPTADISQLMKRIGDKLDESIAPKGYLIVSDVNEEYRTDHRIDLSQIDFDALKRKFEQGKKNIQAQRLRNAVEEKLEKMVRENRTRQNLLEKFQKLIAEYNAGSQNVEQFFQELMAFAQELDEEEKRHMEENLDQEELAIFDLLTKPELELTEKEKKDVKKVAQELLATLKREKIVLDWRKKQQSRAAVKLTIDEKLDELPETFTTDLYEMKCGVVYQHVYESYFGPGLSVYERAG